MKGENEFKPYIPAGKVLPELTPMSVILGIVIAVVFGGANAYLGLRVGMTVSASIPAAVLSMGIIRVILRRDSILENNMVQTIGSVGESVAAGAIFTMPVLFMWATETGGELPSFVELTLIAVTGGITGVFFMIPLRNALIVKEHEVLPYPEGKACAEVLMAGEEGGKKSAIVFTGLGISALYKLIADGLRIFPSEVDYSLKSYKGAGVGVDVLPALLGVGYICGIKVSSYLLAGGAFGWLVLMPLIMLFGGEQILYPGKMAVSEMDTWTLWGSYIRYIGAGAVAAGGIISLIKSLPLIADTFGKAIKGFRAKEENQTVVRTGLDLPMQLVLAGIVVCVLFMWLCPVIPVNLLGAVVIVVFGFFFATVSSRMVGLVGSSNNPVSGMAIATLLFATLTIKASGVTGMEGMIAAIAIGSIICIIAAISGDTSQDLKTGYIVGATPKNQQIGEIIGVVASSLAIGGVLYLLNAAWTYGTNQLPAPQATLMKLVVEGVMEGNLPWNLIFTGVFIAIAIEILQIPILPFAVGLYLPIHLSTPIVIGGLIRLYFEKRKEDSNRKKEQLDRGTLYASGLIAGEGLVGILLAVCAVIPIGQSSLGEIIDFSERVNLGNIGALVFFGLLILSCIVVIFVREQGGSHGKKK